MNELIKLLELIEESKKAEAQKLVDAVKKTIDGLDTKINENESLKNDAITSRDKIKTQLKEIGAKLGINIDTDNVVEAIEAIKRNKGVDKSEALEIAQKEIDTLKGEVTGLTEKLADADKNTKQQMLQMSLKTEIAKVLPDFKAKASGINYITSEVEKQASFEDGKIVFKNEDGTSKRIGGKDATVKDIIEQMKQKEVETKESLFFNIEVQDSGAKGGAGKIAEGDYVPNAR